MKDFEYKYDNTTSVNASDMNSTFIELENAVKGSGQTLNDGDNSQLAKALGIYASAGDYYTDNGSQNDRELLPLSADTVSGYIDGLKVRFISASTNTGLAVANIHLLDSKPVKKIINGVVADTVAGDLVQHYYIEMIYNSFNDCWLIISSDKGALTSPYAVQLFKKISGMTIANNPAQLIYSYIVNSGYCMTEDDKYIANLSVSIIKNLNAVWSLGGSGGAMPQGMVMQANKWYHVFAIIRLDGTVDSGVDTSIIATNLLATPAVSSAGFVHYRHIGDLYVDNTIAIRKFHMYEKGSNRFVAWDALTTDYTKTFNGSNFERVTFPLVSVPPNLSVMAKIIIEANMQQNTSQGYINAHFYPSNQTDPAQADTLLLAQIDVEVVSSFNKADHEELYILTDNSGQIRAQISSSNCNNSYIKILVSGWEYLTI